MKEFLKQLATRLIFTAVKFYQNKTLQEVKRELARRYAGLARQISKGSRAAFGALFLAALLAGGCLLLPLALAAVTAAVCMALWADKPAIAVIAAAVITGAVGLVYVLVPLVLMWKLTSEDTVRKCMDVEGFERRMSGP